MKKKPEFPKINHVEFSYSGNAQMFEKFVFGMICDYLNSEREFERDGFIDNVDYSEKGE